MEKSEIEKALAAFEAKLKAGQKKIEPEPIIPAPPVAPPPLAPPLEAELAPSPALCFHANFKDLIAALAEDYIGKNDAKLWLLEQPDCIEVA